MKRSTGIATNAWLAPIVSMLTIVGCRLGGPTGEDVVFDPSALDSGADGSPPASSVPDAGGPPGTPDATTPPSDAALPDSQTSDDAARDGTADVAPLPTDGGGGCSPTFASTTCDPVCNTGCAGLTRCDTTGGFHEGRCIGIWIDQAGAICAKTASTNNCAVRHTCHENRCVRLCYVDSDCPTAQCCNVTLGTSGYSGCAACP